jgi:hypothetical protein
MFATVWIPLNYFEFPVHIQIFVISWREIPCSFLFKIVISRYVCPQFREHNAPLVRRDVVHERLSYITLRDCPTLH